MKKLMFVIVPILLIGGMVGGCVPTADQIKTVGDETQKLSAKIDAYQSEVTDVARLLEKDGLVNAGKLDKLNEEIDRIQPTVEEMADAIKNAPYTDDKFQNIIIGAMEGMKAGKDFIPAPYGEMGIGILGLLALFLEKKRRDEKAEKESTQAREAAKDEGISKFEGTSDPETAAKLHDIVKAKTANM